MLWGLDAAYPPVAHQPERFYAQGWRFFGGYIGGRAEHVWVPSDWRAVSDAGLKPLPIWVGPSSDQPRPLGVTDGNSALEAMQAAHLAGVCVLDVEDGGDVSDYALGFVEACHAGQCRVVLYGTEPTLEIMGPNVPWDDWWLAFWPSSPLSIDLAPPDWRLWQYAAGQSVDFNVADNAFAFATFTG